ncbi:ent-kaurene oxidase [Physcia stellaris]|nr:ent-kaurene oxidase [Physcia stellaris]
MNMELGSLVNLQFMHKPQDHRGVSAALLGALNAQWALLIISTVIATICTFRSYAISKRPKAPIFKDGMFWVPCNDADILVLARKYVDDIRDLPESKASAVHSHVNSLLGRHSATDLLLESDLHARVVQKKLTPSLGKLFTIIKEEHDYGMAQDLPTINGEFLTARIVSRIFARISVGLPLCRDEEWLHINEKHTYDVFATVIILRMLPKYLHPIVVWFLPSSYKLHRHVQRAKQLIGPIVKERRKTESQAGHLQEKPNDVLQWMMDAATEDEGKPDKLAHQQLNMTLASVNTTTAAITHALLDLCAYPEYLATLREEVDGVYDNEGRWEKSTLDKLEKMDSFLKESQRCNSFILFSLIRVVMDPLKLSDGVTIPKGTQIGFPWAEIGKDPTIFDEPTKFDPLRSYRQRQNPGEGNRHQYTMTTSSELGFGHGRLACPGRVFAAVVIKLILSYLLRRYELINPPGQGRPVNQSVSEFNFEDPNAVLLMRPRKGIGAP